MSYKMVTEILAKAKADIGEALANQPDAQLHQIKLETNLQRDIDFIALISGIGDVTPAAKQSPGPATSMGGQSLKRPPSKPTPEDLEPNPRKVEELRARVESVYGSFLTRESKDLLKEVDDTTLRGVAKRAKMSGITKDYPEEITLAFIEEIRDAITMENARIVARGEQKEFAEAKKRFEAPGIDIDTALSGEDIDELNNLPELSDDRKKAIDDHVKNVGKTHTPPPPKKKK